ncbi:Serine/threonine-protein kinase NIM1 [Symbiodinium microadriaticum]|uniref:Serine/threonine-protein kinase NIM1 n=1 Tax=Symbiodinium microadriaticum TaxID=2951 RepID=A0A1Q9EUP7_SYMMI|nr:Serine/threonine-protein kinase NIM1 [Symbiodinium microadriaticum]
MGAGDWQEIYIVNCTRSSTPQSVNVAVHKLTEVTIMKRLTGHANIIQLFEVVETPSQIVLVMEFANGGDLLRYVRTQRRLQEPCAKDLFKQLMDGLAHVHDMRVVHRDASHGRRLPPCKYVGNNAFLAEAMRSGTISLDNLKRNGPSLDDYADIILDQAHVLDVYDNYFLLMKPKGAAILYDDLYCIYGDSLCGVRHTAGTSRRLLIDMFE